MNPILVFEQLLNGAGYGLMLFLIAAGLTLVFGIMDVMNLSHGSLFMVGAYVAATVHVQSGSLAGAVLVAIAATMLVAVLLEVTLMRRLYGRDHLAQVLATFGVILVADDAVKMVWGPSPIMAPTPAALAGPVELFAGLPYPSYRLVVLGAGVLVAGLLYLLVNHSRVGMLVRAGASDRWMAELMGVRVKRVFSGIFLLGAALAALAGAPLSLTASLDSSVTLEPESRRLVSALFNRMLGRGRSAAAPASPRPEALQFHTFVRWAAPLDARL